MVNQKLMKAARFYKPEEPLRIEEIPIPEIGPEDVLLDVKATGICGSDIHILEGVTPTGYLPITLGHEISGVIAKVGINAINWKVGDRVCVNCIVSCGSCYNCLRGRFSICIQRKLLGIHLNGGLAEYCKVPAINLIKLPENVPFEHGSIITDAVATPYHALTKRANLELGQTVAIFGIGGLGYSAVQLAHIAGASKVIAVDVISQNLERALNIGADAVINSSNQDPVEAIKNMTNGEGVDIALECIGMQKTIEQAVQSVRVGGKAVIVGLGPQPIMVLPPTIFVRSEIELLGSYSFETGEIQRLVNLAETGRLQLSTCVTERLSLDEVNLALDHLLKKVGNPIRIVVVQD